MPRQARTRFLSRFFLAFFVTAMPAVPLALAEELPKGEQKTTAVGETLDKTELKPGLAGSFLSSRFARRHQDLDEAARYLSDALRHDSSNERLMHETMRMQLLAGDMKGALFLAHKLEKEAKTDPLIATLLMLEQAQKGDYEKAKQWAKTAPEVGLFGIIQPLITSWLLIANGEVTGTVDMKDAIEKSGFFAPFLTYHMALMNDVLGNDHLALEAYKQASNDPSITPYRVVEALANFYMRQGKWRQARGVFDIYAKANPDSSLIPDNIAPVEGEVRPLVADAKEGLAELFFTTASILFGEDSSQDTFLYLRVALELRPDLPPAQLMLANLYEQMGDYKKAIATYDSIRPGNVFHRRGQIRKALNYEAMGRRAKAIELLDQISLENPKDDNALITKGDMLREQEDYADAAAAYSEAIRRSEPLTESDWPLLYARGISHERAGDWAKAEADFMRALKLEPNQPDVLNYLAYSWLMMNKNTTKAREYLEIAVSARPEDAHIIDSMGWAEYLAGDFHSAVKRFEKAVDIMPDDPTVNDHLGDAYWRIGRQTEAEFQWRRALNFKPDDATAEQIRLKLDSGLPPFLNQRSQANGVPPEKTNSASTDAAPFSIQVQ